ncbi:PREDICTED: BEL1-like homeodomain protein 9 [Nelumbo nucifera]|uniref:BEL1-like homeodomain protein 9 n=1 Tax=Nelumbo nucifera TaxID=4432 RepID=A0A1U7ZT84_NELNU|nr:PREDICTED: BEL1-like homeodomain protein 9 [Nelumbo nucifera]
MAEGFEPFHVPQQSRRDKLRVVGQNHPTCEEAAATSLQGCAGLLPLYDPSLLTSEMLTCANAGTSEFHHQNHPPLGGAGEGCKQNPACVVKEEGGNLMGYVGGFMNASSSSSSHHPYLDPQSSLALNPSSIQDINSNPFLYTTHNLRDFDHSFHSGEVVTFKPEPLSLTPDSTTTGQGLSLSLSTHNTRQQNLPLELNLQRYESAMFGDKGIGGFVVRGIGAGTGGASTSNDILRCSAPLGPFTGYASILKGSRFLKPAQLLLEEFCGVGRGIYAERSCGDSSLMDSTMENLSAAGISVDDPLGCGDRSEHRRKKTRLISMLDEVYRRYKQYYQQMQVVVASFESVPGLGNASPYTSFALKTMSKHFKCLKNAITDQICIMSKGLGEGCYEKDEAPRFGSSDRAFQCQRPVNNSGIVEHQHIWRPQRGLPERAVAVLRAWLFEHFLRPYPTDTDKQMLAKQTGLSRSQVSNWFINARVRLWKPMVEEIHMLETRQAQKASETEDRNTEKLVDHPPPENSLATDKQPQNSSVQKTQDPPLKRTRNDLPHVLNRSDVPMNFSYHNIPNQVGVSMSTVGINSGVSLTLGLQQNNGIGLSEPFTMNIAHRFGLEANNEGYVMGGFEAQNRQFGKDIGGQLLHDFVG